MAQSGDKSPQSKEPAAPMIVDTLKSESVKKTEPRRSRPEFGTAADQCTNWKVVLDPRPVLQAQLVLEAPDAFEDEDEDEDE